MLLPHQEYAVWPPLLNYKQTAYFARTRCLKVRLELTNKRQLPNTSQFVLNCNSCVSRRMSVSIKQLQCKLEQPRIADQAGNRTKRGTICEIEIARTRKLRGIRKVECLRTKLHIGVLGN
jgi:hypothetical protein